jgi:hypothetical protein
MRPRGVLIVVAAAALATACSERLPTAPRPAAVEPGSAHAGAEVPVVIRGSDFYLGVQVSSDDGDGTVVSVAFRACVDAGVELGIDVNGAAPGRFNGARPDLGAAEAP